MRSVPLGREYIFITIIITIIIMIQGWVGKYSFYVMSVMVSYGRMKSGSKSFSLGSFHGFPTVARILDGFVAGCGCILGPRAMTRPCKRH